MKNRGIIFIVFVAILISFFVPNLLFWLEDFRIEKQICTIVKPKSKVDVQAEKIYLVKAIHDMEGFYRNLLTFKKEKVYYANGNQIDVAPSEIVSTTKIRDKATFAELENEIDKLENGNVLKNVKLGEEEQNSAYVSEKIYPNEKNDYKIKHYYFKNSELEVEIENKTGKILSIIFPKDNLIEDTQELKKNFVKYLDLYIIDDWKLEKKSLKSEKAQLEVVLIETQEQCRLTICPMGYEIVEKAE